MKKNDEKYKENNVDFEFFATKRNVSHITQFVELFKRNLSYIIRNPRGSKALIGQGCFMGLLILSLFWQVGEFDEVKIRTDPAFRGRF